MARRRNSSARREEAAGEWILVGMDFSRASRKSLGKAWLLARERGCGLVLLHVIDAPDLDEIAGLVDVPPKELRSRLSDERGEALEQVLEQVQVELKEERDPADTPVESVVCWGHPFEEIVRKAREFAVDLIVLGSGGRSADLEKALFGGTAEKVLRAAHCPVLCVPADA